ncbi:MAG: hypothetical protein PHH44_01755 [bacterium]|nr:hypothetical protein [bacterium]
MFSKKLFSILAITLAVSWLLPRFLMAEEEALIREELNERGKSGAKRHMLIFSGGGYLGRNKLLAGYEDYTDNYSGHLEVRMGLAAVKERPDIVISLNYDFMPLILPDGIYGMSENIISINLNAYYVFYAQRKLNFFAGPGIGYYFDTLTMDTPASGKLEHQYRFVGYNLGVGAQYYLDKFITLIPLLKYHQINEPGSFKAKHLVFQVGFNYNFAGTDWNKWKKD